MTTDTPHARVESAMPGRLRIRLDRTRRHNGAMDQVHDVLGGRDGIHSVSSNPMTGSVLVHYDRDALEHDDVLTILRDAGLAFGEAAQSIIGGGEVGHSIISTHILDALTDLDHRLSRATNGLVDIKLLFPLTLGTLAIRQIVTNGLGLGTVPGYVLLWYTFDSFYKLHPRAKPAASHGADAEDARAARDEAG